MGQASRREYLTAAGALLVFPLAGGAQSKSVYRVGIVLQGGPDTRGHGNTGMAKLRKQHLVALLQQAPRR
jgi:hypothetical protein